jgi:hypothetical protein
MKQRRWRRTKFIFSGRPGPKARLSWMLAEHQLHSFVSHNAVAARSTPIATLKIRICEPTLSQFRRAAPTQAQVIRLPMAAIKNTTTIIAMLTIVALLPMNDPAVAAASIHAFGLAYWNAADCQNESGLMPVRFRSLPVTCGRELPCNEKQIGNAGPLEQCCNKWISEQQSRDAGSAGDQHARKSEWHAKHVRQRGAKTVIRAGHRCNHVVGSRRVGTDERQYCQREQLFKRHCESYSSK